MIMNYLRNEHKKVRVRTVRFTKSGSLSLFEKSLELKSFGRGGFNVGTCTFESQTRQFIIRNMVEFYVYIQAVLLFIVTLFGYTSMEVNHWRISRITQYITFNI